MKDGQELTMFYLKLDVLMLADIFENFVQISLNENDITPLFSYSLAGYTGKAGLKHTGAVLDTIRSKHLLLSSENNIRGGISTLLSDRYV